MAGLSRDSVASHQRCAHKLALDFPLLADPETGLIRSLGAWGEKTMYGRRIEGPRRSTFVAGRDGRLLRVYGMVKPAGHAEQVLKDLRG